MARESIIAAAPSSREILLMELFILRCIVAAVAAGATYFGLDTSWTYSLQ
ncbi:hypothetical protein [Pectobacterium phage Mimer]|nr:DNA packaging protein [Pectobacterium phage Mimer]